MPKPIDVELARWLFASMLAWVVALAWTHPRAVALKSEPGRALGWYAASFLLALVADFGALAASNHERHGLALTCCLASLAFLALLYPRARDFPEEEPPPRAPIWDGAIAIKRFACPHCRARTFSFSDKFLMQSTVLRACRKCGAWITVLWFWDAIRWATLMLNTQGLPFFAHRAPTSGLGILLVLSVSLSVAVGMWVGVSTLMPLVTRYPPPSRSTRERD